MPLDVSTELEDKYTSSQRMPAELYTIWNDFNAYYLTSSDQSIDYDGHTFEPARLKRGNTQLSADLTVSSLSIEVNYLQDEVVTYLSYAPIDQSWVKVEKVFLDQSPMESIIYFIGIIDNVAFQGQTAIITASGVEKLLRAAYPKLRYQPRCPLKLYSDYCGVNSASYSVQRTVQSISTNGLEITLDTLVGFDTDYFIFGYIQSGGAGERMITGQSNNTLTVRSIIPDLEVNDVVTLYAGCNKSPTTCNSKFNNLGNASLDRFLGFIYIPNDNPATWVT